MSPKTCLLFAIATVLVVGCKTKIPPKPKASADPPGTSCAASSSCRVWGWCAEQSGECVATSDDACRNSEGCKLGGLCSLDGIRCVAKSSSDCKGSEWCKRYDLCSARAGVCR